MEAFPRVRDDISATWLSSILRRAGVLPKLSRVESIELEPAGQRSSTGSLARVGLSYDGPAEHAPRTVIVKLASKHRGIRSFMRDSYRREVRFYEDFGADAAIAIPRVYGVAFDGDDDSFFVVMDDLGTGAKRSRLEAVEQTIERLAPFHARWWNSQRLVDLEWLAPDEASVATIKKMLIAAVGTLPDQLGPELPATFAEVARVYAARFDALHAPVEKPYSLTHGDLHLQQVHFGEGRYPFAVYDWQSCAGNRAAVDVSRLIVSSTDVETQEQHEERLVRKYHEALCGNGVEGYSLEQCWEDYRRTLLVSVAYHMLGAATLDLSNFKTRSSEEGRAWSERFFGWVDAALVRHDVLGRLPGWVEG